MDALTIQISDLNTLIIVFSFSSGVTNSIEAMNPYSPKHDNIQHMLLQPKHILKGLVDKRSRRKGTYKSTKRIWTKVAS